jgi:hypothetical protein
VATETAVLLAIKENRMEQLIPMNIWAQEEAVAELAVETEQEMALETEQEPVQVVAAETEVATEKAMVLGMRCRVESLFQNQDPITIATKKARL